MAKRTATAKWSGSIMEGEGRMALGSGTWEGPYSFKTRFEGEGAANPEELIGAAHAGCFTMSLSGALTQAGHAPESIETRAEVSLVKDGEGFTINKIGLFTEARIPGLGGDEFERLALTAKENCPVSKALAGPEISLEATLVD